MAGPTLDNGELLAPALEHFDVFVTVDRNLSVNGISHRDRSLVVLDARTNRLADLKPLLSKLLAAIDSAQYGVPRIVA